MIAKLRACEHALGGGVDDVVIVDGRDRDSLRAAAAGAVPATATRVAATAGIPIMTTTSTSALEDIQAREARHVLQTYRRAPLTFVRGKGVRLYDSEGREYLDLLSGIGVASLGHAHEGLARAIADQAQTLLHTSNLFFHPLQGQVGRAAGGAFGAARACSSATAAPKPSKRA